MPVPAVKRGLLKMAAGRQSRPEALWRKCKKKKVRKRQIFD